VSGRRTKTWHLTWEKVKISRRENRTEVRITDSCKSGVVFMTFHFGESATNIIPILALDPISKNSRVQGLRSKSREIKD